MPCKTVVGPVEVAVPVDHKQQRGAAVGKQLHPQLLQRLWLLRLQYNTIGSSRQQTSLLSCTHFHSHATAPLGACTALRHDADPDRGNEPDQHVTPL